MDDKIKQIRFDSMRARNFFEEYLAFTTGPVDLKKLMDKGDVALLDVRLKADYDISHILKKHLSYLYLQTLYILQLLL